MSRKNPYDNEDEYVKLPGGWYFMKGDEKQNAENSAMLWIYFAVFLSIILTSLILN